MVKKEHKKNYRPRADSDSIWNRSSSTIKGGTGQKSLGGKEIMQMLGIDQPEEPSIQDKSPMKMMDLVMQMWDVDGKHENEYEDEEGEYDGDEEDEEEEPEDEEEYDEED